MRIFRVLAACSLPWLSAGVALGAEPDPKVVATWASGAMEARVAFDRAVDPTLATAAVGRSIGFGAGDPSAKAGRPGGDRGALRVASARLADGGRTLILVTDPHPREATYALKLAGVKAPGASGPGAEVDVAYTLGGVEATWSAEGDRSKGAGWSGWWPELDPAACRAGLAGSSEHDRLWPLLAGPGRLALRTLVALPAGAVTLRIEADAPFEATFGQESATSAATPAGGQRATLKGESTGDAIDLGLTLKTGAQGLHLAVAATAAGSPEGRAIPKAAFVLPWAPPALPSAAPAEAPPAALLSGGDPTKGRAVFYGEQAKCATCHKVRGEGGSVGPELTALAGVDRAWVYRNIVEPSASIHPDYVSYTVAMKDGRIAMGVVRADGPDALQVGDIDAKTTRLPRAEVDEIRPSASSIMPVGLLGAIGEERTRDLLAFLTEPAPKPGLQPAPTPSTPPGSPAARP